MAKEYKDLVIGLDIGTSKVMVVVAEVLPGAELKLAGFGIAPSSGLKRGVVVNIDATVQSIQQDYPRGCLHCSRANLVSSAILLPRDQSGCQK
jgi:Tfp pilus assembly PilM family ATPase